MQNRIIELEDLGQDFTEFEVDKQNVIVAARPFQGWLWKGFEIIQHQITPRMKLRLRKRGQQTLVLKYSVVAVK